MSTNGPRITVRLSCFDCRHEDSISYRVQGDSGQDVFCNNPEVVDTFGKPRRIGDSTWDTPMWCPFLNRKEKNMEKLGVKIDEKAAEVATKTKMCPKCGQALVGESPPQCPSCGTEPFESREEK